MKGGGSRLPYRTMSIKNRENDRHEQMQKLRPIQGSQRVRNSYLQEACEKVLPPK